MSVPIAVSRALYKGLMSATREFSRRNAPMLLRLPVEQANIGWMRDGRAQSEYVTQNNSDVVAQLFPMLPEAKRPDSDALDADAVRELVRDAFRAPSPASNDLFGDGLSALKTFGELVAQSERSSCTTTEAECGARVTVEATSSFRGSGAQGAGKVWAFEYRIRVRNDGDVPVQLLGREWCIRNADGSIHGHVPKGSPGVVGETPVLQPKQAFEYASGTTFNTAGGSVEGSFQMARLPGLEKFDAAVARFDCFE